MSKLVSVIIPAFNAQKTIGAALQSLEQQDYDSVEIIVIDDKSKVPLGLDVLRKFTTHQIKLFRNDQNIGANQSINKGFDLARGEYVSVLAADDSLPENSISSRVDLLDRGHDLVFGGTLLVYHNEQKEITNMEPVSPEAIIKWIRRKNGLGLNNATSMFSADLRATAGYRLPRGASGSHEDYEYALRLLLHAKNPARTETICYNYYLDDNGSMLKSKKNNEEAWEKARAELEKTYYKKFLHKLQTNKDN